METEKITNIKGVKCHCYDGTQCEPAIYAKSDSRPGYRWYVGYGGDYMPAGKADIDNMREYGLPQDTDYMIGMTVDRYRK